MANDPLVLAIVLPLVAFMGWVYGRLDRKFDGVTCEIKELKTELKEVKTSLSGIDSRLSKIEGKLEEREFQEWKQKKIG